MELTNDVEVDVDAVLCGCQDEADDHEGEDLSNEALRDAARHHERRRHEDRQTTPEAGTSADIEWLNINCHSSCSIRTDRRADRTTLDRSPSRTSTPTAMRSEARSGRTRASSASRRQSHKRTEPKANLQLVQTYVGDDRVLVLRFVELPTVAPAQFNMSVNS